MYATTRISYPGRVTEQCAEIQTLNVNPFHIVKCCGANESLPHPWCPMNEEAGSINALSFHGCHAITSSESIMRFKRSKKNPPCCCCSRKKPPSWPASSSHSASSKTVRFFVRGKTRARASFTRSNESVRSGASWGGRGEDVVAVDRADDAMISV